MKTKILYNSLKNSIFWYLKDTSIEKEADIEIVNQKKNIYHIKTDKYDGTMKKLSKIKIFFMRYFLPLFVAFMFIQITNNWIKMFFVYGDAFVLFGAFLAFFSSNKKRVAYLMFLVIYGLLNYYLIQKFQIDIYFLTNHFMYSLNVVLALLILFKVDNDYKKNKIYDFFYIKDQKLIVKVLKEKNV